MNRGNGSFADVRLVRAGVKLVWRSWLGWCLEDVNLEMWGWPAAVIVARG